MSKVDSHIQSIIDMGEAIKGFVTGKLYFSGLHDTPTGYQGHSGDYLVVNNNESGIHFTGIEKIAADLTDYGFGGGTANFTGLLDTPTGYDNAHYLRSSTTGIEYVDPTSFAVDAFTNITGVADSFIKIDTDGTGVAFGQPVEYVDSLPTTIPNGKLVSYNCDLYMGCDGTWESVRLGPGSDDPLPIDPEEPLQPVVIESLDDCTISSDTIPMHSQYATYGSYQPQSFVSKDRKTLINLSMYVENYYQNNIYHTIKNETTGKFELKSILPWNKQIRGLSLNEKGNIVAFVGPIDTNLDTNYLHAYKYLSNSNEWERIMPPVLLSGVPIWADLNLNDDGTEITIVGSTSFKTYSWNGNTFALSRTDNYPSGITFGTWPGFDYSSYGQPDLNCVFSEDGNTCAIRTSDLIMRSTSNDAWSHTSPHATFVFKKINNTWTHIQSLGATMWIDLSFNGKFLVTGIRTNYNPSYGMYEVWEYNSGQYVKITEKNIYPRELLSEPSGTRYGHEWWGFSFISNDGKVVWFKTTTRSSTYPYRYNADYIHAVFWLEGEQRWQIKTFTSGSPEGTTCKTCNFWRTVKLDGNASELTFSNQHYTIDPNCVFTYFGESSTLETEGSVSFMELAGVPDSLTNQASKVLSVSSDELSLEFTSVGDLTNTAFTGLSDAPSGYQDGDYLISSSNEIIYQSSQTTAENLASTITQQDLIQTQTNLNFQTKYLTTSHTSNSVINDLSFNDLTIGNTYRMSSTLSFVQDGMQAPKVSFYHDGNKINEIFSSFIQNNSNSTSLLFNATSNELTISGANLDSSNYIGGNVDDYISFVQIESLSNQTISPEIITLSNGDTVSFSGETMSESNFLKIEGENVSATIQIDGDSFIVAQSGEQMVWDQGGSGETTLSLGESINITLSNGRVVEIRFYQSGSLYFAINKKSEPTTPSTTPPVTPTITPTPTPSSGAQNLSYDVFPSDLPFKLN